MNKGRSLYNFQLNCDLNKVKQLIQNYINDHGFQQVTKNWETYYQSGDLIAGNRCFNYRFSENKLTIYAWWIHAISGEMRIEQEGTANHNMHVMNYRSSLSILFQEIEKLNQNNTMNFDTTTGQPIDPNVQYNNYQQNKNSGTINTSVQNFNDETLRKKETAGEFAFWASIVGLMLPFFGMQYTLIGYIVVIIYATQGIHTRKRKKAIAALILSTLSFILLFFFAILAALME